MGHGDERSIGQVARISGVTARTLRHYDHLGLLTPSRVAANGYRWYGRAELRRLQRILLLRELDVPLARIAELLDETGVPGDPGDPDAEAAALREHRAAIAAERDRLDAVLATIDRTLAGLAGGREQSDAEFFEGLEHGTARLRAHLVGRYGEGVGAAFEHAARTRRGWTRADHEREAERGAELLHRLSALRAAGVAPDSETALDAVAEHHAGVLELWPADAAAYHALGDVIRTQPDQRAMLGADDPALPDWLGRAVQAYAAARLGHDSRPDAAGP